MGKTKVAPEIEEQAWTAADEARALEVYDEALRLKNPTNQQILEVLRKLPPRELKPSAAEIIRELRGPLPGDPDAEPLPDE